MGPGRAVQRTGERIPRVSVIALALIAAGLLSACGTPAPTRTPTPEPGPEVVGTTSDAVIQWTIEDDEYFAYTRRDAIAPIYDPAFVTADAANLAPDALIVGLEINGEARAYPKAILISHGMVNDTVGDTPIIVSW